jgi:proline iminopeptidase
LTLPDGARLYWEASGQRDGMPALYLHGGPGGGLRGGAYRRQFDPAKYLIIGFDQRGCGRSTPDAGKHPGTLTSNNTPQLWDDIEHLRQHFGVERWVLHGVSWGASLALSYAQAHPERAAALVLAAVTMTTREEVDWITQDMGRIFPEAWERFEAASERRPGERIVEAYARRLANPSPEPAVRADRLAAAAAWNDWEATHISLDPRWTPEVKVTDSNKALTFATLVTHYWAASGFLTGGLEILANLDKISHLPGVLVTGRHDVSDPPWVAWRLHRAWPGSVLHIVEGEGHGGPHAMDLAAQALDALADQLQPTGTP